MATLDMPEITNAMCVMWNHEASLVQVTMRMLATSHLPHLLESSSPITVFSAE